MLTRLGSVGASALKPRTPRRTALAALTAITLISTLHAIDMSQPAPPFTAKTIAGEKFTSGSLKGSVVLLQFWATWCGVCRGDQLMLDGIDKEFANRGLVVLAVNRGESKRTVKQYLNGRPRSCRIVLTEDTNLAAIFPTTAVPYYVLIDRDGKVIEARAGGGERLIRYMLNKAFRPTPDAMNLNTKKTAAADAASSGPPDRDLERPTLVRRETRGEPTVEPVPPPDPLITVKGLLNRLDCLGEQARLHVVAGQETFVLLIRQPDRVLTAGGRTRELRCGLQKTAVSVHFAPGKDDKYGTSGDVRAIEFIDTP